jgi:hypothetical protein
MSGEQPDPSLTQELLDDALESDFESEHMDPRDLELLQLMGVR